MPIPEKVVSFMRLPLVASAITVALLLFTAAIASTATAPEGGPAQPDSPIDAVAGASEAFPQSPEGPSPNPFAGANLFVDAQSNARQQISAWQGSRPDDIPYFEKIASSPLADWIGDWNSDVRAAVDARVSLAEGADALAVLVAYNIPVRDCDSYSDGGATSPEAYLQWVRSFGDGIGTRRAAVILEPDALPQLDCLSPGNQAVRLWLIQQAVEILAQRPNVSVYLNIGHPNWLSVAEAALRLNVAGIRNARGFSLNVSNFYSTADNLTYGQAVSALVGDKAFVVDTSRNGLGPGAGWCNPDGRALGQPPTALTGVPLADAFLWIKPPGESDGTCNGGPEAGAWWPEYALGLAVRSPY